MIQSCLDEASCQKLECGGATHVGRRRLRNEDAYQIGHVNSIQICVIADGMGGHPHGDLASHRAIQWFHDEIRSLNNPCSQSDEQFMQTLRELIANVQKRFVNQANEHPDLAGMGTTLTAVLIRNATAHLVHLGDSRCLLQRNADVVQLSTDHTVMTVLREAGVATRDQPKAAAHALWNCLGACDVPFADVRRIYLVPGDRVILCSDGLTNMLDNAEINSCLIQHQDPTDAANALIEKANEAGGRDNITVIVGDCASDS